MIPLENIVIVSAVRTALGRFNGSLAAVAAIDLGKIVIEEALKRGNVAPALVTEVIMGHVLQAGLGQNPVRQAALKANLANEVSSFSINKVCGSGLKSIALAAQAIKAGNADIVVAGGMENMSQAAYVLNKARWGLRMGDQVVIDTLTHDGLICAMTGCHMGMTAENIVEKYGISRKEQDEVALISQQRAIQAQINGVFNKEIVPVKVVSRKGEETEFDKDETPRAGMSLGILARLKPVFKVDGSVTAGNSSGINDGAAAVVLMKESKAKALGLNIMARIRSYASAGVSPEFMGLGPVTACKRALANAGLTVADLDLVEANEAFAAQFLGVDRALHFDREKTNVNGGAIALGHPIGASGARTLVTLLHSLQARDATLGLSTLCIGGGQGIAMIVERI